ncbi:uncharacterized protein LOC21393724 [Morus notabilis]|nr:uncharacterized protein LOC21393724 [Morus notabilis]
MSLIIPLSPKFPTLEPQKLNTRNYIYNLIGKRSKTKIKCSDADLASKLAKEVAKMNTLLVERNEAMEKSRDLLFRELCNYLSMEAEEVKNKWKKMEDEEKWVLVEGFVSDWGVNFHPLSARSVKELIQQHLQRQQENDSSEVSHSSLFPSLKKIMGFSQNK